MHEEVGEVGGKLAAVMTRMTNEKQSGRWWRHGVRRRRIEAPSKPALKGD
jgi:hypothetical protein